MYCVDTSSLLEAWIRSYPPNSFPGLWDRLDSLIGEERLWSSEEVLRELEQRDDDMYEWASDRDHIFLPLDEDVQDAATRLLERHPRLMGERANRNHADPFVIATAWVRGLAVVTEEAEGSAERPRIPFVCQDLSIPNISVLELIQQEGWVFD